MHRALHLFSILLLLVLSACDRNGAPAPDRNPTADPPITILGARVVNGPESEPIDDAVVVCGTVIETIGSRANTPVPKGGTIVDGSGQVLIARQALDESNSTFESIEIGAQADLVLLHTDPLADIQNVDAVERVMQGLIPRSTYSSPARSTSRASNAAVASRPAFTAAGQPA